VLSQLESPLGTYAVLGNHDYWTDPDMARKYPAGLQGVTDRNRWVYTTRGVGHLIPARFNCPPEVTLLILRTVET
jgi:predicted MPP superfamily phosphohydrolase